MARGGTWVELELAGATRAAAGERWLPGENLWTPGRVHPHGLRCVLVGRATADLEQGVFERFELAGTAVRWGRTHLNGRGDDPGPSLIGFHLERAPAGMRLAPTFVALYGVPWIPRPAVPTWRVSPEECGLEDG